MDIGSFQKYVLIIALVILIITLLFIGITIKHAKKKEQWPPVIGDCPDYWIDLLGNGEKCVNVKDLGSCTKTEKGQSHYTMDFSVPAFTGSDELCSKYNWANKCGVTWDGITYGASNPCNT
jgi:hypothetical protein